MAGHAAEDHPACELACPRARLGTGVQQQSGHASPGGVSQQSQTEELAWEGTPH